MRIEACRLVRGAWIVALAPVLCAQAINVNDLIAAQRKQIESGDFRATGRLVWVQAGGARITNPISIKARWFPGVLRVLVNIADAPKAGPDSPVQSRTATNLLLEMRPKEESSILIAHPGDKAAIPLPFAKWSDGPLGPGFSYEDFLQQQFFWPGQTSEGEVKFGARDCDVVQSTPGPTDRTHYSAVKTWFDHTAGYPVYVEKTMKETGAVKEFTSFGMRREQGTWAATQIEVKTRGQGGSALLIFNRGSAKANLTIADFSPAQLTRFPGVR